MGWLHVVGSLELQVSFAKEPYKRDYILAKETYNFYMFVWGGYM